MTRQRPLPLRIPRRERFLARLGVSSVLLIEGAYPANDEVSRKVVEPWGTPRWAASSSRGAVSRINAVLSARYQRLAAYTGHSHGSGVPKTSRTMIRLQDGFFAGAFGIPSQSAGPQVSLAHTQTDLDYYVSAASEFLAEIIR